MIQKNYQKWSQPIRRLENSEGIENTATPRLLEREPKLN